jgi:hypothetical protein
MFDIRNSNLFLKWLIAFLTPPPLGGYWNFQTPLPKIQQKKKEFPREGLNFKKNLWKFHGVG